MLTAESEAIVLSLLDYGEADRIVTLFTKEWGRISAIARSAKKSRKRFGGALELFARLTVQARLKGEGLSSLASAEVLTLYPGIRRDLERIAHAGYACELVAALLPEHYPAPRLYRLTVAYLERLEEGEFPAADRRFFEMNLLNILGYRPALDHCASCGCDLSGLSRLTFSAARGGMLCPVCGGGTAVSAATANRLLQTLATGRFGSVSFSAEELAEAEEVLDAVIASHLDRPLKSTAFLHEVSKSG